MLIMSDAYIQMPFRVAFINEANNMNPDLTAPNGTVISGFILYQST